MLLRINFKDNDFASPVYEACAKMMIRFANKGNGIDAFEQYQQIKKEYGIERIRQGLIYATFGFMIVYKACELYEKPDKNMLDQEFLIEYLEKNIEIEEVETLNTNDDNHQTCYIDFFNLRSFLA